LRFEWALLPITDEGSFVVEMFSLPSPARQEEANKLLEKRIVGFPGFFREIFFSLFNLNIIYFVWREKDSLEDFF
jgi:hypothetical protein